MPRRWPRQLLKKKRGKASKTERSGLQLPRSPSRPPSRRPPPRRTSASLAERREMSRGPKGRLVNVGNLGNFVSLGNVGNFAGPRGWCRSRPTILFGRQGWRRSRPAILCKISRGCCCAPKTDGRGWCRSRPPPFCQCCSCARKQKTSQDLPREQRYEANRGASAQNAVCAQREATQGQPLEHVVKDHGGGAARTPTFLWWWFVGLIFMSCSVHVPCTNARTPAFLPYPITGLTYPEIGSVKGWTASAPLRQDGGDLGPTGIGCFQPRGNFDFDISVDGRYVHSFGSVLRYQMCGSNLAGGAWDTNGIGYFRTCGNLDFGISVEGRCVHSFGSVLHHRMCGSNLAGGGNCSSGIVLRSVYAAEERDKWRVPAWARSAVIPFAGVHIGQAKRPGPFASALDDPDADVPYEYSDDELCGVPALGSDDDWPFDGAVAVDARDIVAPH